MGQHQAPKSVPPEDAAELSAAAVNAWCGPRTEGPLQAPADAVKRTEPPGLSRRLDLVRTTARELSVINSMAPEGNSGLRKRMSLSGKDLDASVGALTPAHGLLPRGVRRPCLSALARGVSAGPLFRGPRVPALF